MSFPDDLSGATERFDFFSALRAFEASDTTRVKTGYANRPGDEGIRLGQTPTLSFVDDDLSGFEVGEEGQPHRLTSYFYGLFGPNGPLPHHLTEYAIERTQQHRDESLVRFLDMFHHRLLSFMYRAWADSEPAVQNDRPADDSFRPLVGALVGKSAASSASSERSAPPPELGRAGLFALLGKSPAALESIISGVLGIAVRVEEYVGEWLEIPTADRFELGRTSAQLGSGFIGEATFQRHVKFRLHFGPLDLDAFKQLLPSGDHMRTLRTLVRGFVCDELAWDVHLVLKQVQVPPFQLGRTGQLGWTTWVGEKTDEADEVLVEPLQSNG